MSRILIAGCGMVGTALGIRLAAVGHTVWGLRRNAARLPDPILPFSADLTSPESLAALPDDLDFVFYTASSQGRTDDDYRRAYVEGIVNLLRRLSLGKTVLRRIFFASSTGVYAQKNGDWVDEDSPAEPAHFSGRRLLEGERVATTGPFPATVVRFGGIYGPERTGLLERIRTGRADCPEGETIYSNLIHVDDCVGTLEHLMHLPRPEQLYLAVDCQPSDYCEVVRWLAKELAAPVAPGVGALPAESRKRRSNKRCSNRRLTDSGYRFRYPSYRDGYGRVIREYLRRAH